ncbi:MAG TPA: hypothetical protein VMV57_01245 [Terracidiphilus sp.]|nr:hypothetical protein [Terracidiphilus sp.]
MRLHVWACAALLLPLFAAVGGCHSYQVSCTVVNRTGATIHLMEVDYPSAGFGTDSLANGASYPYRFQIRGSGPVDVQYTESATHKVIKIAGPAVREDQEGRLEIVLLPGGKAQFHAELNPPA